MLRARCSSRSRSSCSRTSACSSATATRSRRAGLALLLLPRVPGIGQQVNGAYLGVGIGAVPVPARRVRQARDRRLPRRLPARHAAAAGAGLAARAGRDDPAAQALRAAARGVGRGDVPARLHPRPRLVADVLRRLPRAALRGHQPALVRDDRDGAVRGRRVGHVPDPRATSRTASTIWLDPFKPRSVEDEGYQIAQSLFAQADGGLFGTGFGQSLLSAGRHAMLPAAETDLIYAVIVNELGLVGRLRADARLPAVLRARHEGRDARAPTRSPSCWPPGLTAVFALQVFVIVGGVTQVIPLTGVTLPFVSYGGSSIVANFVLLALLLLDLRPRRAGRRTCDERPDRPPLRAVVVLFGCSCFTSRWSVFRPEPARQPRQPPRAAGRGAHQARHDPRRRRQGAGPQREDRRGALHAPLPDRTSCSRTRSATRSRASGAPASSSTTTTR